jgi:hypothetical protein
MMKYSAIFFILTTFSWSAPAEETVVKTADELTGRAAAAGPGDTIIIADGDHANWRATIASKGTKDRPVVVRPQTAGGVTFRLDTRLAITGDWIVFRGFCFDNCGHMVAYVSGGSDNRITECRFTHCGNPQSTFAHIVEIGMGSHRNRVDHCFWTGSCSMSLAQRNTPEQRDNIGKNNRFDHNVFRDVYRLWINGQENIQMGQGRASDVEPLGMIDHNLFENAWGDSEIFSNKTSRNTYRCNVAANCRDCGYKLRAGDNCLFDGNVAVNCDYGLLVYGSNHTISNNLFLRCARMGIRFEVGYDGGGTARAPNSKGGLVAHNTFVHCGLGIGSYPRTPANDGYRPQGLHIVNNLFTARSGTHLDMARFGKCCIENNLFWTESGPVRGETGLEAITADPRLVSVTGADARPAKDSPAVDRAVPLAGIVRDRQDRARPQGKAPDLGADELPLGKDWKLRLDLPHVPQIRPWRVIDLVRAGAELFKGRPVFAHDHEGPLARGRLEIDTPLPRDFVLQWEYRPESFRDRASVRFCADGETGYCLRWGGAARDGRPEGIITLHKNGELVARRPDPVHYRRVYFGHYGTKLKRKTPNPELWYRARLVKHGPEIRLILNRPAAVEKGRPRDINAFPAVVWRDTGRVAEKALTGAGIVFSQEAGSGHWRKISAWQYEDASVRPPAAPEKLAAEDREGYVRLTWKQAAPYCFCEVHCGASPDFKPGAGTLIAPKVRGAGLDDFAAAPGRTRHYKVRMINILGRSSPFAAVSVVARKAKHVYILKNAQNCSGIESPMTLMEDELSGTRCIGSRPDSGKFHDAPPPKGRAEFEMQVARAGDYHIYARVLAPDGAHNSFFVALPGSPKPRAWSIKEGPRWQWARVTSSRPVRLKPGKHTIRFQPRECGAKLETLLLTDDETWRPVTDNPG